MGNQEVISRLKLIKSNCAYGMFLPLQEAAVVAVTGDQGCVEETRMSYQRRRDVLCDGLCAIGWEMERSPATMFVWAPIPSQFESSEAFSFALLERAGVMVTPGSAFGPGGEGFVRMALVQDEAVLHTVVERIRDCGILREKKD